ncbi:MAG: hypothetical protein ABI744_02815 [Chloroflexota bacterium]
MKLSSRPVVLGIAALVAAVMLLVVFGGGLVRAPIGPPSSPTDAATTIPVGRVTNVTIGGGAEPQGAFLLAGNYWVTEEVHAGASLCTTVVAAVDASYNGDYRAYRARNGVTVDFAGLTLDSDGSGSTAGLKSFPPGTYRFIAGAYPPLGPPKGDGTAALCEDWTMTLEAR